MSAVLVVPCLGVRGPEVAEARRTLLGQGRLGSGKRRDVAAESVAVQRALWIARALPIVVEILAGVSFADIEFGEAEVELGATPPPRTPLRMLAFRRDDECFVEVLALTHPDLSARHFESPVARVAIPFRFRAPLPRPDAVDDDITAEDNVIRLQRFTVTGRTPGT